MPSEKLMPSVNYGTTTIEYRVQRKKTLKNTYINIDKNGVLVKTNNQTSASEIEDFIIKKASWIVKHLQGYKSTYDVEIITGSRLYYLGKSYYVAVVESGVDNISVEFTHSKFKIQVPLKCSQMAIHKAVDEFYKEKAIKKITPLVKKWSKVMNVQPEHISFRKSEKRWGSCSPTNRISFNYHLMKISTSLIEYVVIHELSHIKYKNHSKEFWLEVKRYLPDYKAREDLIKGFEKIF